LALDLLQRRVRQSHLVCRLKRAAPSV
jgi:hypothetical protein